MPTMQLEVVPETDQVQPEGAVAGRTTVLERSEQGELANAIRALHTVTVSETLGTYTGSVVLGSRPSPINDEERSLRRKTRSVLAQLRSGLSRVLNIYLARVNPVIVDVCKRT